MNKVYIDLGRANFERYKAVPRDVPIHMLNLIKFRDIADYRDDHPNHGRG